MKLNRNQLKYLVIAAMVIDHIAWSFVPAGTTVGVVMHTIGRLTGPTMAFFLAEGYQHTRNVKHYAMRLAIFALISWIPYSLYETGYWPSPQFGVIYTLFLGLIAILVYDKTQIPVWAKWGMILVLCGLSIFGDWQVFDVVLPLLLWKYRDDPAGKWKCFFIISLVFALLSLQFGVLLAPLLLRCCYNGQPGSRHPFHKWFFYWFYPAHLLLLWLAERSLGS